MRRITKSQMIGFRLNKNVEPVFQKFIEENCFTASEYARQAVEEKLRRETNALRAITSS